jgi:23S rRNA (pseudouridine1915-N3)-methyltransferase
VEIRLLAVGKLKPALRDAADDYLRRLRRYGKVTEVEIREAGAADTVTEGRRQEGIRLRDRLPPGTHLVALDQRGRGWTSEELAAQLDSWLLSSRSVTLIIGGSHGLEPSLVTEAAQRWSLGPMTLPHQLARVVVVEQLYRAWTILRGEPYHK